MSTDAARTCAAQGPPSHLPPSYLPARWRSTLPPDPHTGEFGLEFSLGGRQLVHLRLPPQDARRLAETLRPEFWEAAARRLGLTPPDGMPESLRAAPEDCL
jgi:hypothetical protein